MLKKKNYFLLKLSCLHLIKGSKILFIIDFKKDLKIDICFSIPKLNNKNFRNFKSKGGGCYNDMSVYAFKCIDLFCKKDIKKKLYFKKKN